MLLRTESTIALLLAVGALRAHPVALSPFPDTVPQLTAPTTAPAALLTLGNVGGPDSGVRLDWGSVRLLDDTIPKPRRRAYEYSDGYARRNTLHRRLSYAMLPLFAVSYVSGDQILNKGAAAPAWARSTHRPAANVVAALFAVNTVTGTWNLWEGRGDPNGRKRRILHSVLFMGASAGFVYAGSTLAEAAERSDVKRRQHRNVNLASMGVSTASWLLMFVHR